MMSTVNAFENFQLDKGYDVSSPITAWHFVKDDGSGGMSVAQVSSADDVPIGVAQFHTTATEMLRGKGASVRPDGISQIYISADGNIENGDLAGLTADGSVRVAQSGDRVVGQFRSNGVALGRAALEVVLPGYILS
jgi:hypothetical protein